MKLYVTAPLFVLSARLFLVTPAAFAASSAIAPPTAAPPAIDDAALAQVVDLNKKAIAALKSGQPDAAMTDLQAAAKLAQDKGLSQHDIMARTQIHLGICAITGLGDRGRGLEHFARALAIRPDIKLGAQFATPALARDLRRARRVKPGPLSAPNTAVASAPAAASTRPPVPADVNVGKNKEDASAAAVARVPVAAATPGSSSEPPRPTALPQPLYCPTPDQGPPNAAVPLFCLTQEHLPENVVAYFRSADAETYTAVPMSKSPTGWMSALVPANVVKGRALQVYFEARDSAGTVAANNGKDEMPNVIALRPGAPRVTPQSLALIEVGAPPPASEAGNETGIEETPLEARARAEEKALAESGLPALRPRRKTGGIWVGFGLGSGYGWQSGLRLERHTNRSLRTGFSPAGLGHIAPEIGYQLTPRLSLSLQSRHQYLPTAGSGDAEVTQAPPELAHALLLRVQYALLEFNRVQFIGGLSVGGGDALRLRVAPNRTVGIATSDTVVAGRGVAGPSLAVAYNFSQQFAGLIEARALAGFPVFAVLMEGTASLQYTF